VIECVAIGNKGYYRIPSDSHSGNQKPSSQTVLPGFAVHTHFRNICMHLMIFMMHKSVCTYTLVPHYDGHKCDHL
jgi:hypothetical protein